MKKLATMILALCVILMGATATAEAFEANSEITVVSREDGSGTRGAFIELMGVGQKKSAWLPGR